MEVFKKENLNLEEITEALRQGKVIVYPTETVYGLGCDVTDQIAVDKIFEIKQRQKNKPVLMVAASIDMVMEYVEWNEKLEELAQKYWPGPLTIVAPVKTGCGLVRGVVSEDDTVAFRVTEHHLAQELSEKLGKPIVSTSANISNQESSSDAENILAMFESQEAKPDIVIDAGELPHRSPSTIIKVTNGEVEVLRQGELIVE